MTPLQREALQMCLEYIETDAHERRHVRWKINEALAEPQQEPVACKDCGVVIKDGVVKCVRGRSCWVGQQPAQRKPLTDEEIMDITMNKPFDCCIGFARAIEAAHGIKKNT